MSPLSADAVILTLTALFHLDSLDEVTLGQGRSLAEVRTLSLEACSRMLSRRSRPVRVPETVDLREASVTSHAAYRPVDSHPGRLDS
jgi:hypothetical protein